LPRRFVVRIVDPTLPHFGTDFMTPLSCYTVSVAMDQNTQPWH
jgi:hypothetical protein